LTHLHTSQTIQLTENNSPSNPASGHTALYPKADGLWYQRNAVGYEFKLGSQIVIRNEFQWDDDVNTDLLSSTLTFPRGSVTNPSSSVARADILINPRQNNLITAYASNGTMQSLLTAANFGTVAGNVQVDSYYVSFTTTAVSGSNAGFVGGVPSSTSGYPLTSFSPVFTALVRTGATITGSRIWVGLSNSSSYTLNSDNLAGPAMIFRFNGTGGWTPLTYDTSQTTGTTIGTVAINTAYLLKIRVNSDASSVFFSVDNGVEQEITTNIPTNSYMMYCCIVYATTASARQVQLSHANISYRS
jgi:hypothetical protein